MYLKLDTQFKPGLFKDKLEPYIYYKLAYDETEKNLSDLILQTEMWRDLATRENSPIAFSMYQRYSSQLNQVADDFSKGMNAAIKASAFGLRKGYAQNILPIAQAYNAMKEANKFRETVGPDGLFEVDSYNSLDPFLKGGVANNKYESKKELIASTSALTQAISQSVFNNPVIAQSMSPLFLEVIERKGIGSYNDFLNFLSLDATASNMFSHIYNLKVEELGGLDRFSPETRVKIDLALKEGMYSGIYNYSVSLEDNKFAGLSGSGGGQSGGGQDESGDLYSLPFDPYDLISPNLEGEAGYNMANSLRNRLGISSDGSSRNVNLSNLVVARSDVFTHRYKSKDNTSYVRFFSSEGNLLSKESVLGLAKYETDKRALGKYYDNVLSTLRENLSPDENGKWSVSIINSLLNDMQLNRGAYRMSSVLLNFGKLDSRGILESLVSKLGTGDGKANIRELTRFDKNGTVTTGNRVSVDDLIDDDGNAKGTPAFYAVPNEYTNGIIMKLNGKTYFIDKESLGGVHLEAYNIIPSVLLYYKKKKEFIDNFGELAYYDSKEGNLIEENLRNFGEIFTRGMATSLGYTLKAPDYTVSKNTKN